MSEHHHVTVDNTGETIFSTGLIILLFLFFPIGVIVLIVRTIRKWKESKAGWKHTNATTVGITIGNDIEKTRALQEYYKLLQMGLISRNEYEQKKKKIMGR